MADDFTLKIRRFEPRDRRLGRHVLHDSRSLRYRARAADPATLRSVRHAINIPVMDQGNLGSCTGHAGTATLGSDPFWPAASRLLKANDAVANSAWAVRLYSEATRLDPWPGEYEPEDTGSDGLSIAKALHARGLISGYQHATSLAAALTALSERVVMVGSSWLRGMYDPAADGRLRVSGVSDGGHEYVLDELDVERQRVWMRNSWGQSWGIGGRAWMTWEDLARLLADYGDCTVLVPLAEPPPIPGPDPQPQQSPEEKALAKALRRLVDNSTCPVYLRKPAAEWLKRQP
jgi:hypothetical protein